MQSTLPFYRKPEFLNSLFCFGLLVFVFGINWSLALVSNSIIFLSVLMILKYNPQKQRIAFNLNILKDLDKVLNTPLLLIFICIFLSVFFSGLWSESMKDWAWFSRMKLPFILLPFTFFIHGRLNQIQWKWIGYIFVLTSFFFSAKIMVDYFQHFKEYNLALLKGKTIVNHISHIRFSMMIAMNTILCLHLYLTNSLQQFKYEKLVSLLLFLYFFIFNHIISVKTGILGMYLALFVYICLYFYYQKSYKKGFTLLAGILVLIILSFTCIPSLQNKFYYTIWQIGEWQRGKWLLYSDLERFVSWQMGIEMIKQNPILGSGMGDLYQMTKETYLECFGMDHGKLPHNQFLFSWAFTGLAGMMSLLGLVYYTVFQKSWWKEPLIIGIQMILLFSFLFEYTLETQVGCNLYVYFTLMSWMY
ncbi:MAG: O-antigen ligase family protein, partial [Saprospiraceae bacterium]